MKATLKKVLDTQSKAEKRHIKLRITHNRIPRLYSGNTTKTLTLEEYHDKRYVRKLNSALEEIDKAYNIAREIIDEMGNDFTHKAFVIEYRKRLNGEKKDLTLLTEIAEKYFDENKNITLSTIRSFKTAVNWFNLYKKNIKLSDIQQNVVEDFVLFIKKSNPNITENSIRLYLRSLRALYNYAIYNGIVKSKNPFSNNKNQPTTSIARTKTAMHGSELLKFIEYIPQSHTERLGKDFFTLSILMSGANLIDILKLKNKDLNGNSLRFIRTKTKKTKIEINLQLLDEALELFNRYGKINPEKPDNYILPYLNGATSEKNEKNRQVRLNKKINKGLESICENCNIRRMTYYNARHTYASIVLNKDFTKEQIRLLMGHTSSKTTEIYLNSITDSILHQNSNALKDALKL